MAILDNDRIQEIVEQEGGTLIGIQGSFYGEEDGMVLFIFPESKSPHAVPITKFSPDEVRAKRRKHSVAD